MYKSSIKTGPVRLGHIKIALDIAAVDVDQYRYNNHMWQTQPVATLLRAFKGQTSASFNLGWRLPFTIFWIKIDA